MNCNNLYKKYPTETLINKLKIPLKINSIIREEEIDLKYTDKVLYNKKPKG